MLRKTALTLLIIACILNAMLVVDCKKIAQEKGKAKEKKNSDPSQKSLRSEADSSQITPICQCTAPGQVCQSNVCVCNNAECVTDLGADYQCQSGSCVQKPPVCTCSTPGQVCQSNVCVCNNAECVADLGADYQCQSGSCVQKPPVCACTAPGQVCQSNVCVCNNAECVTDLGADYQCQSGSCVQKPSVCTCSQVGFICLTDPSECYCDATECAKAIPSGICVQDFLVGIPFCS